MKNFTFAVYYSAEDGLWFATATATGAPQTTSTAAASPDAALRLLTTFLLARLASPEEASHA